jgi:hypothetical protein
LEIIIIIINKNPNHCHTNQPCSFHQEVGNISLKNKVFEQSPKWILHTISFTGTHFLNLGNDDSPKI